MVAFKSKPIGGRHTSWLAWLGVLLRSLSSRFKDPNLEAEYQLFALPPFIVSIAVEALSFSISMTTLFLVVENETEVLRNTGIARKTLMSAVFILLLLDLALLFLKRRNHITPTKHATLHEGLRVALLLTLTASDTNSAIRFWSCGFRPARFVSACFQSLQPIYIVSIYLPFWLPISFHWNLIRYLLFSVLQVVAYRIVSGQAEEVRFTFPTMTIGFATVYLALQWRFETEDRQRFVLGQRQLELERQAKRQKAQVTVTLSSLCDSDQLQSLLAGVVLRKETQHMTVLTLMIDEFLEWRQLLDPKVAISLVDLLFREFESLRFALKMEKLSMRGDCYVTGLHTTATAGGGASNMTTKEVHDPSRVIVFASKALDTIKKRQCLVAFPLPQLRIGIATGDFTGALVPGSTVAYLLAGSAITAARKRCAAVEPSIIVVDSETWKCCQEFTSATEVAYSGQLSKEFPMIRFVEVRRLAWSAPAQLREQDEVLVAEKLLFSQDSEEQTQHQRQAFSLQLDALRPIFVLSWCEGFVACVERREAERNPLFAAVWFSSILIHVAVQLTEDAMTPASGILLLIALLLCATTLMGPTKFLLRGRHALLGLVCMGILAASSLLAKPSLLNDGLAHLYLPLAVQYATVGDSFPFPFALAAASSMWALVFGIVLGFPRQGFVLFNETLWAAAALIGAVLMMIHRQQATHRFYTFVAESERLASEASEDRDLHERVLGMLLPSYIVPFVALKQRDAMTDAIADSLTDEALLYLRMPVLPFDDLLVACRRIQGVVGEQREVGIVYMDGDTVIVGGPLQRPRVELGSQPAVSRYAGVAYRQLRETVANDASLCLVRVLKTASRLGVKITAVLHREDALAVVLGSKRPSFSVEGKAAEVGWMLLNSVADGSMCATTHFCELLPDNNIWKQNNFLLIQPSMKLRLRSVGIIHVNTVLPVREE